MAFLVKAFKLFNGWLGNLMGGLVSVGTITALAIRHPAWALVVFLATVVALLMVAGIRLENQLQALQTSERLPEIRRPTKADVEAWNAVKAKQARGEKLTRKERRLLETSAAALTRRGYVEMLGIKLRLGQLLFGPIVSEGQDFQRDWAAFVETDPDGEAAKQWLAERLQPAINDLHEWKADIWKYLSSHVGVAYPSRFSTDAGLTPRAAPASLTDEQYISAWQDHDLRMQRLNQIIEELGQKWNV